MNVAKVEISEETMKMLEKVSTASISLQLLKRGIRSAFMRDLRPLNPADCRFVAEAYTLRFVPMREDLSRPEILADPTYSPRLVIEDIPAGAALVIDARGVTDVGVVGGIFGIRLRDRGCAAIVTDGAVRDSAEMMNCGFPVFCGGVASPASLDRRSPACLPRKPSLGAASSPLPNHGSLSMGAARSKALQGRRSASWGNHIKLRIVHPSRNAIRN